MHQSPLGFLLAMYTQYGSVASVYFLVIPHFYLSLCSFTYMYILTDWENVFVPS